MTAASPQLDSWIPSGRVLVVEDQVFDRDLLVRILSSDGHTVHTAATGEEALRSLERIDPHVVLCDVVMPEMNGLEFCRKVKSRDGLGNLPVLLVTGRSDHEDLLEGFDAGADDYITKPIEARELSARVRTMIRTRQLQNTLADQTDRLRDTNREMEGFIRAVSHDLRAPVISLIGLAGILDRKFSGQLPEESREIIARMCESAESISALVNHLVGFARLGRTPHRPIVVELRALVEQACTNLTSEIQASNAQIELQQDWPEVKCDPVSICQVFQNLIANSIKFIPSGTAPRIKIANELEERQVKVSIRDNGIGIPEDRLEDIFQLFTRLGQMETEGHGVGLSTTYKVLKMHGGRIWAESTVGEGSTFCFTLPHQSVVADSPPA